MYTSSHRTCKYCNDTYLDYLSHSKTCKYFMSSGAPSLPKTTLTSSAFSNNYLGSSNGSRFANTATKGYLKKDLIADKDWLKQKGIFCLENKQYHNNCFLNSVL